MVAVGLGFPGSSAGLAHRPISPLQIFQHVTASFIEHTRHGSSE